MPKNDDIHLYIIQNEYERLRRENQSHKCNAQTTKQIDNNPQFSSTLLHETIENEQSDFPNTLRELQEKEIALITEKDELTKVKRNLTIKIVEEIKTKKDAIDRLKEEILEARKTCRTLESAIENLNG